MAQSLVSKGLAAITKIHNSVLFYVFWYPKFSARSKMELIKKRAIAGWGVFIERLDQQKTHTIKIINPKSLV
ncbi:hypothetical protein EOE67_07935 [Rheinheimera riviphila]|uniref:Uncharacterized protein n=1 Tax=Rheinheimera riviphila TaxID=1834037 RepID=A0A437R085_9GAMM|nr:hypothetical protein [Rheinheimera riviphila]RVU40168.1 hypothetical protein EOE67_07935 [Rheinheimera riviphila]